jgi:hypothetical protein
MHKDLVEIIDNQIATLERDRDLIKQNAQSIITDYWTWMNAENKKIAQLRKVGETKLNVSSIAPVIEVKKNKLKDGHSEFVYIVWKSHNATFRNKLKTKIANNASLPIHSYDSKRIDSILAEKCSWNASRALETEKLFKAMRVTISGIQKAITKLRYAKTALNKLHTASTSKEQQEIRHAS